MFTANFLRVQNAPDWVLYGWKRNGVQKILQGLNVFFVSGCACSILLFFSFVSVGFPTPEKYLACSLLWMLMFSALHYLGVRIAFEYFSWIHSERNELRQDVKRLHLFLCQSTDSKDWSDHTGDEFTPGHAKEKFLINLRARWKKSFEKRTAFGDLEARVDNEKGELKKLFVDKPERAQLFTEALDAKVSLTQDEHGKFFDAVKSDFEFAVKMGIFPPDSKIDQLLC